jgi:hypothetical protein
MATRISEADTPRSAVERLADRDEILEICFWYEGEGLGDTFTANALQTFLRTPLEAIETSLELLRQRGCLTPAGDGYRLTEHGRREGGRLFADHFADFQKGGHGECDAGCCEGDDHSECGDDCTLR